jgi:hypothetical protein
MDELQQELAAWKERAFKAEQERDALIISIQAIIIRAAGEQQTSFQQESEKPNPGWADLDNDHDRPHERFNLEG